jgi:nucleoside-diphosphate-sugar epimerase
VNSTDVLPAPESAALLERSRERLARTVLVTGATGFIGTNVVRALLRLGSYVHATVQPTSSLWRLEDVRARIHLSVAGLTHFAALEGAFQAARPRVVLHLATPRGHDESDRARLFDVTMTGALHLARLARTFEVESVVVAGSSLEYGPSERPLTEESPIEPVTAHGLAKAAASLLWERAARDGGLRVCILRLSHVYGPWESPHRLLPSAVRAVHSGMPLSLTAGSARRDWVFVGDVVDAFARAVGLDVSGQVINVGSGQEHTNADVVASVSAAMKRPIATSIGAFPLRATDPVRRRIDCGKARRLLGWVPTTPLSAGVQRSIEWFTADPDAWLRLRDRPPLVC